MLTRNRAPAPSPILPQELITEILLRLPPKFIGKFRCVSKQWRSMLSNPHFIKSHLTLHSSIRSPPNLIMISTMNQYLFTITFNSPSSKKRSDAVSRKVKKFQGKWESLLGSCHGLVLVGDCDNGQFLMNPTTLELVKVPDFSLDLRRPLASFINYGFGYDSSSDDYKIVRLSFSHPFSKEIFVDVCNLKMKTWRRIENSTYVHAIPREMLPGVFFNGAIHWLATGNGTEGSPTIISAFNLSTEKFEQVPAPASFNNCKFYSNQLFVFGGCLGMLCDRFYAGCTSYDRMDIWVMNEYGVQESWTKFSLKVPRCTDWLKPICQLGDEEVVLLKDGERLVLHNLKELASRDIEIPRVRDMFCNEIINFSESLVSPKLLLLE